MPRQAHLILGEAESFLGHPEICYTVLQRHFQTPRWSRPSTNESSTTKVSTYRLHVWNCTYRSYRLVPDSAFDFMYYSVMTQAIVNQQLLRLHMGLSIINAIFGCRSTYTSQTKPAQYRERPMKIRKSTWLWKTWHRKQRKHRKAKSFAAMKTMNPGFGTRKPWHLSASLTGWGAPNTAAKTRSILEKHLRTMIQRQYYYEAVGSTEKPAQLEASSANALRALLCTW